MDINYTVKAIIDKNNNVKYGAYENNHLIKTCDTYEQAEDYIDYWKKVMR